MGNNMHCNNLNDFLSSPNLYNSLKLHRSYIGYEVSELSYEDVANLANLLTSSQSLTSLCINAGISQEGIRMIAEALESNQFLTTFSISADEISAENSANLAKMLEVNQSLTTLTIDSLDINNEDITMLARALINNSSLTTLNLRVGTIGREGATAIAKMLEVNKSLSVLKLNQTIGSEEFAIITEALKSNDSIAQLQIQINRNMDRESAISIANMLEIN